MLTTISTNKLRMRSDTDHADSITFTISRDLETALRALSMKLNVSMSKVLLTAFHIFLQRYTNQEVLEFSVKDQDFANCLVLHTELSVDSNFIEVLHRVKQSLLAASTNPQEPLQAVPQVVQPDLNSNPAQFQVLFIMQSHQEASDSQLNYLSDRIKFDLIIELSESSQSLVGRVIYAADLFEPQIFPT